MLGVSHQVLNESANRISCSSKRAIMFWQVRNLRTKHLNQSSIWIDQLQNSYVGIDGQPHAFLVLTASCLFQSFRIYIKLV